MKRINSIEKSSIQVKNIFDWKNRFNWEKVNSIEMDGFNWRNSVESNELDWRNEFNWKYSFNWGKLIQLEN